MSLTGVQGQGGVQPLQQFTAKVDQFVQSTKAFFGRGVDWVKTNVGDRIASHFQTARDNPVPPQMALTRQDIEKAIPSSRVLFDALDHLDGHQANQTLIDSGRNAHVDVSKAVRILTGDIPMGGPELTSARQQLTNLSHRLGQREQQLTTLIQQNPQHAAKLQDILNTVTTAKTQIDARNTYLGNFEGSHSLTAKKVEECKVGWTEAAARVIDEKIGELKANNPHDPRIARLEKFANDMVNTAMERYTTASDTERLLDGANLKSMAKSLGKELSDEFKSMGLTGTDPKRLAKEVNSQHVEVLNDRHWVPIQKEIQFVHDGKPYTFKSDITPAGHLDTLKSTYDGKGICCQSRSEAEHAVNLAKTELRDENNNVVFQGVRHGIISAFGVEYGPDRVTANENRAKELMLGVVSSKQSLLTAALNWKEGDEPIALDMTSINLLTPDPLRWQFGGKDAGGTDRAITRDQLNTLRRMDGGTHELKFTTEDGVEHTIKVKPNIAAFSFGVNEGATRDSFMGGMMYYLGGKQSFNHVREDNQVAMEKLIGNPGLGTDSLPQDSAIAKFLNDPTKTPQEKQVVRELREQIRTMWNDDNYMAHGGDPHKMVSRIAVLSHVLGGTPCFNCKSGKDRTGTLDVEAKYLATRIMFNIREGKNQLVPPPGPLNVQEQSQFRQFAINSGNLEVQEFNTGIGGYKTAAQKALQRRLGTEEAVSRFKGGSGHVKA